MTRITLTERPGAGERNGGPVAVPIAVPVHDAETLLDGGRKAAIILGEQIYTLQITRQGKLLLTK